MSSHNLHSLIAAIDRILPKVNTSVSQLTPNDLLEQSLVLQQVRSYLVALDSQNSQANIDTSVQPVTRQVVDAVGQKIPSLGSNSIKPLQAEVELLQQQKAELTSELGEMEALRQQYYFVEQQLGIQQQTISEFLLVLSDVDDGLRLRTQESLTPQVAQIRANLDTQFGDFQSSVSEKYSSPKTTNLEKARQLQLQSEQLLITLDSTFKFVFESLQHNLKSYQESLTQGMENLYQQQQKSEVMFKALRNQIAQQVRDLTNIQISAFEATTNAASTQTTLASNQQISKVPPIARLVPNFASSFRVIKPYGGKQAPQGGKLPYSSTSFISKPTKKPLGLGLINHNSDLKNQPDIPKIQYQQTETECNQLEDYTPESEEIDLDLATLGVQPIDVSDIDKFLHDEIAALTSSMLVEDALGDEKGAQDIDKTTKNNQPLANTDTITQIADLVPADAFLIPVKSNPNSVVIPFQLLTVDPNAATVEDNYIVASPKEYLIPTNESSLQSDIKQSLPQDALQKLTEDLSMFEWCERQGYSEDTPTPIVDLIAKAPTQLTILKYGDSVLSPDKDFELELFYSALQHLDEDLYLDEETLINNPFKLDFQEDFNDNDYSR